MPTVPGAKQDRASRGVKDDVERRMQRGQLIGVVSK